MKIIKNDHVYLMSETNNKIILADNDEADEFVKCINEFFGKKKKNYCKVYSDDQQLMLPDEMEFIYYPLDFNLDPSMDFKTKTELNQECTKFIEQNMELFQSVDRMRENVHELLSDRGVTVLQRIMENGLEKHVKFEINNFNVSDILQFLSIQQEEMTNTEKLLVLYNILLYVYRYKTVIVYIDIPIDQQITNWIEAQQDKPIIFLMKNNILRNSISSLNSCAILKLSSKDYMERYEYDINELSTISYILTPFIQQYLELQTEKNIILFNQFNDNETTFYLEFNNQNNQNRP